MRVRFWEGIRVLSIPEPPQLALGKPIKDGPVVNRKAEILNRKAHQHRNDGGAPIKSKEPANTEVVRYQSKILGKKKGKAASKTEIESKKVDSKLSLDEIKFDSVIASIPAPRKQFPAPRSAFQIEYAQFLEYVISHDPSCQLQYIQQYTRGGGLWQDTFAYIWRGSFYFVQSEAYDAPNLGVTDGYAYLPPIMI